MAFAYDCFKKYKRKEFLTRSELEYAVDHVCLNLNNPLIGYKYFYNMYSYNTKSFIVCNWKEQRNLNQDVLVKFGEAICNDQLVNFLKIKNTNIARVRAFIIKFN